MNHQGCIWILAQICSNPKVSRTFHKCVHDASVLCAIVLKIACTMRPTYIVIRYHPFWTPPSTWPPHTCIFNDIVHTAHWLPQKLAASLYSGQTSWQQSVDVVLGLSHLLFLCYCSPQIRPTRSLSIHEL